MKRIVLTQGKFALVDDGDFEYLNQWKWYYNDGYARRSVMVSGKYKTLFMHRLILNSKKNEVADHIDGDGLNNQKNNLRVATRSQNQRNKKAKGASVYLGVSVSTYKYHSKKDNTTNKRVYYRACITDNKKVKYLGCFKDESKAALAYNKAAKEIHGEFARLNNIVL